MPSLTWIGKEKIVNHHKEVPLLTLEERYSYPLNYKQGQSESNYIVHGDNLYALKALLPKYEGKIDLVYIDPPYNTGNEKWVYNDNVNDPTIKKWLGEVVGAEGEDMNRHDKWLCMMYPRLKLLQKLLSTQGTIAISIDDTEAFNLRLICDEIFGYGNFIADVIWEKADSPRMDAKSFSTRHDHTLIYSKTIGNNIFHKLPVEDVPEHYNKTDSDGRRYYLKPLRFMGKNDSREARPNLFYPLVAPDGTEVIPKKTDGTDGNWRWSKEKYELEKGRVEWIHSKNGWVPYTKLYADSIDSRPPETIWYNREVGSNRTSISEIKAIFEGNKVFDTPKPTEFIQRFIQIFTNKDSIVLDSFAGSGSTGHAVLKQNYKDGGKRRFILIEMLDYAESVTAERVKKAIGGYQKNDGLPGSFIFYDLGEPLFNSDGYLNENLNPQVFREYIWYSETRCPLNHPTIGDYLGTHNNCSYYFMYDRDHETELNDDILKNLVKSESYVIYADSSTLSKEQLTSHNIVFKKIPRDIWRM